MDGIGRKLMILLLVVLLAFAAVSVFKSLTKRDETTEDSASYQTLAQADVVAEVKVRSI